MKYLLSLVLLSSCASNSEFITYFGEPVCWPIHKEVVFNLAPNFPNEFVPQVEKAFNHYNNLISNLKFTLAKDRIAVTTTASDKVNSVAWLYKAWPFQQSAGAVTSTKHYNGTIMEADVYFHGETLASYRGDLEERLVFVVLVHELGHVLGLNHSNLKQSIMFPSTSLKKVIGEDAMLLSRHDKDNLSYCYTLKGEIK